MVVRGDGLARGRVERGDGHRRRALAAAPLAAGGVAAGLTARIPAGLIGGAAPAQSVIILDPNNHGEVFAPPPSDAARAMTAQEALDAYEGKHVPIPDYVTVQLGLYTLSVGPDCGPECEHNNIVQSNMVYSVLNKLVYGFSRRACPVGSDRPDWQLHPVGLLRCDHWQVHRRLGVPLALL